MGETDEEPEELGPKYETRISLRIKKTNISPAEISDILGMVPDGAYSKGDRHKSPKGQLSKRIYDATFWHKRLSGSTYPPSDLVDELMAVLVQLEPHADLFAKIRASGGRSEFFIGWFLKRDHAFNLPAEVMTQLAALGIDLDFDVYIDTD